MAIGGVYLRNFKFLDNDSVKKNSGTIQRCHMAFFRAILDKCGYFWKSFSRKKLFGYKLNFWLFCGYFSKLLLLVAIWLFCGYFKPFLLLFQSIRLFFSNLYLFKIRKNLFLRFFIFIILLFIKQKYFAIKFLLK